MNSLPDGESQLNILFNSKRDAVAFHHIGADGKPTHFIRVNDVACERLGYSRDEMLQLSPQDIDVADHAELMLSLIHI